MAEKKRQTYGKRSEIVHKPAISNPDAQGWNGRQKQAFEVGAIFAGMIERQRDREGEASAK